VLLEGRVRFTALALAPKHLPDELELLDILDEITFSKPVHDGFGHFPNCECARVASGALVRVVPVLFACDSIFE
jgi:hypothetical protein